MAEGAKGTATDVYVLDTGQAGAERLRLLDQVYGPWTRAMLLDAGLDEGMRVLDLACGIGAVSCWIATQVGPSGAVVAADVNPDQLVVSKGRCAQCAHLPVEYVEASAYATGFAEESFDLVHMRLLLCHLTEPAKVLREIYRILKPGGALVCQDVMISSIFCSPRCVAYERFIELGHETGRRLGVDYDFGARLPAAALEAGFGSVDIRLAQPAYLTGPEKRLWEYTFAEAAPVVFRNNMATTTEEEVEELLREMAEFAADKRTLIAQACLPGVIARK